MDGQLKYGPMFDLEGRFGAMTLVGFRDQRLGRVRPFCYTPVDDKWHQ
jgi:hypothetical protein